MFYQVFTAFLQGFVRFLQRFTRFHKVSARLILFWILNSHPQKKYIILEKKPKRDPPTATGIHVPPMNIARQVDFAEVSQGFIRVSQQSRSVLQSLLYFIYFPPCPCKNAPHPPGTPSPQGTGIFCFGTGKCRSPPGGPPGDQFSRESARIPQFRKVL